MPRAPFRGSNALHIACGENGQYRPEGKKCPKTWSGAIGRPCPTRVILDLGAKGAAAACALRRAGSETACGPDAASVKTERPKSGASLPEPTSMIQRKTAP